MGVSLFTVRVVLDTLGAVDYGIYNVVAGVVVMFSFLSGTMARACQRFFAFELGKGNYEQLRRVFSLTMLVFVMIAIAVFILAETVGLWFLCNKMTIPTERIGAALWVYQFSILSFMMTLFTIPYNAVVIAREKMNVFAWVSIFEVGLKLLIVYLLVLFSLDKLKLYAVLIFVVTSIVTLVYRTYSIRRFAECRFSFFWDRILFEEIVRYSGWNLFGSLSAILNSHGVNVILNLFFGPVVNTANGIARQLSGAINGFVTNFSIAVNPQITKHYASGDVKEMERLVFQSSKLSYFLMFTISMPLLLDTNYLLTLWLKELVEYVALFTQLVIIAGVVDSLSNPIIATALATGKVRNYQILIGGIRLLGVPVSYLLLKFGYPPQSTMYLAVIMAVVSLFLRLLVIKRLINFPISDYFNRVIVRVLAASLLAYIPPTFLKTFSGSYSLPFLLIALVGFGSCVFAIYYVGFDSEEKKLVKVGLINALKKCVLKRIEKI